MTEASWKDRGSNASHRNVKRSVIGHRGVDPKKKGDFKFVKFRKGEPGNLVPKAPIKEFKPKGHGGLRELCSLIDGSGLSEGGSSGYLMIGSIGIVSCERNIVERG